MSMWDDRGDQDGGSNTRLARSQRDKVVFGVCGGVGEATGIDPLVLRLGLIALTVVGVGWTIPLYIVAGIVMRRSRYGATVRTRRSTKVSAGWTLVVVGAFIALQALHVVNTSLVMALVMIVVGINLVIRHRH